MKLKTSPTSSTELNEPNLFEKTLNSFKSRWQKINVWLKQEPGINSTPGSWMQQTKADRKEHLAELEKIRTEV